MTPVSDVLRAAAQAVANDPTHDDFCWPSEGQHSDACNRKRDLRAALAHAPTEGLDVERLADDVRYADGNGTSDYWRGFNDGIDKLVEALLSRQ